MSIKDQLQLRFNEFMAGNPDLSLIPMKVMEEFIDQMGAKYISDISYIVGCGYVVENNLKFLDELWVQLRELGVDPENFEIKECDPLLESEEQKLVRQYRETQHHLNSIYADETKKRMDVEYFSTMLNILNQIKEKVGWK